MNIYRLRGFNKNKVKVKQSVSNILLELRELRLTFLAPPP